MSDGSQTRQSLDMNIHQTDAEQQWFFNNIASQTLQKRRLQQSKRIKRISPSYSPFTNDSLLMTTIDGHCWTGP